MSVASLEPYSCTTFGIRCPKSWSPLSSTVGGQYRLRLFGVQRKAPIALRMRTLDKIIERTMLIRTLGGFLT